MILTATLDTVTSADGEGAATLYEPGGPPRDVTVVLISPPGLHLPWRAGDRIVVAVPNGEVAAGVIPLGVAGGATPQHPDNTELRSRGGRNVVISASEGGEVRLGYDSDGAGTEYDGIMLKKVLSAEILNLQAQINALAAEVDRGALTKPVTPPLQAVVAVAVVAEAVTGGEAVAGVRGVRP